MDLTESERAIWHDWKRAGENVLARVGRDIAEATGLSGSDYGVVSRLDELGNGKLRQQELASSMGWDKSRLSHHLTRMEERGLVTRELVGRAVNIALTREGRKLLGLARPVHAASIRKHLLAHVGAKQLSVFADVIGRLAEG
ncbi:MAG TPA: MarR family transcriptional regulator [Kofleriaceae bacterium]